MRTKPDAPPRWVGRNNVASHTLFSSFSLQNSLTGRLAEVSQRRGGLRCKAVAARPDHMGEGTVHPFREGAPDFSDPLPAFVIKAQEDARARRALARSVWVFVGTMVTTVVAGLSMFVVLR